MAVIDFMPRRGIYVITNTVTGDCYVGKSTNVDKRMHDHLLQLMRGKNPRKLLQAAWNTHGGEAFTFEAVEMLPVLDDPRDLDIAEARWMGHLAPAYNRVMSGYWPVVDVQELETDERAHTAPSGDNEEFVTAEVARQRLSVSNVKIAEWFKYGVLQSEPSKLDSRVKLVRVRDIERLRREREEQRRREGWA